MDIELLSEKYGDRLDGVLQCYDRITLHGSLHPFCYAKGMTNYLYAHQIRIFDGLTLKGAATTFTLSSSNRCGMRFGRTPKR